MGYMIIFFDWSADSNRSWVLFTRLEQLEVRKEGPTKTVTKNPFHPSQQVPWLIWRSTRPFGRKPFPLTPSPKKNWAPRRQKSEQSSSTPWRNLRNSRKTTRGSSKFDKKTTLRFLRKRGTNSHNSWKVSAFVQDVFFVTSTLSESLVEQRK